MHYSWHCKLVQKPNKLECPCPGTHQYALWGTTSSANLADNSFCNFLSSGNASEGVLVVDQGIHGLRGLTVQRLSLQVSAGIKGAPSQLATEKSWFHYTDRYAEWSQLEPQGIKDAGHSSLGGCICSIEWRCVVSKDAASQCQDT